MRKLYALFVLLTLGLNPAVAQERKNTAHIGPLGYCQLSLSTVVAISTCSGGIPVRTVWAVICVEGAIRWRDDGTNATSTVGMPLSIGQCMNYSGTMSALTVVSQSGTVTVNISFYDGAPPI